MITELLSGCGVIILIYIIIELIHGVRDLEEHMGGLK